jgi:hypothetical protein
MQYTFVLVKVGWKHLIKKTKRENKKIMGRGAVRDSILVIGRG